MGLGTMHGHAEQTLYNKEFHALSPKSIEYITAINVMLVDIKFLQHRTMNSKLKLCF